MAWGHHQLRSSCQHPHEVPTLPEENPSPGERVSLSISSATSSQSVVPNAPRLAIKYH